MEEIVSGSKPVNPVGISIINLDMNGTFPSIIAACSALLELPNQSHIAGSAFKISPISPLRKVLCYKILKDKIHEMVLRSGIL